MKRIYFCTCEYCPFFTYESSDAGTCDNRNASGDSEGCIDVDTPKTGIPTWCPLEEVE